jgi:hypothetical protein
MINDERGTMNDEVKRLIHFFISSLIQWISGAMNQSFSLHRSSFRVPRFFSLTRFDVSP